ncbi:hypothetical protein JCM14469_13980 [Desulfatiferula olefinivorans]
MDPQRRQWTAALVVSVLLHIGLCIGIAWFPHADRSRPLALKSIDVDLSYLPAPKGSLPEAAAPPAKTKPAPVKKAVKPAVRQAAAKKVSIAPKKKAAPVKKNSVKPEDAIDKAIKRLEKDLASSPRPTVDPVTERIKQLERETRTDEPVRQAPSERAGTQDSKTAGAGSAYDVSLLDRYRHNVSMEIREQWAFSEQLAAGRTDLVTKVTFEVLPDGEIRGVRITRRSGNDYMDSSATMAIVKAGPVRPHPPGLNLPFIDVKLEFTPKGLE